MFLTRLTDTSSTLTISLPFSYGLLHRVSVVTPSLPVSANVVSPFIARVLSPLACVWSSVDHGLVLIFDMHTLVLSTPSCRCRLPSTAHRLVGAHVRAAHHTGTSPHHLLSLFTSNLTPLPSPVQPRLPCALDATRRMHRSRGARVLASPSRLCLR